MRSNSRSTKNQSRKMNRDRTKSSKSDRSRQHDPNAATGRTHHRSRRDIPGDWSQGSSTGNQSAASIRFAADLLGSCSSGWLAVYLRCVADGTIALHRCEAGSPREQIVQPVRPHKPKHWICKAWSRCCTSASVSRAIYPTMWALIDVALVVFFLWTIIQACRP